MAVENDSGSQLRRFSIYVHDDTTPPPNDLFIEKKKTSMDFFVSRFGKFKIAQF